VFGTKEWAKYSANVTIGCSNNCIYCYSRDSYEKKGSEIPWSEERVNEKLLNKKWGKRSGRIMFPTSHDITKNNYKDCLIVIKNILNAGNEILIVSKPDPEVMKELFFELKEFKDKIIFRFTIGSMNNEVLKFWEPNAPTFEDRKIALIIAYKMGYKTSVSMEPLLDISPRDSKNIVNSLIPYVTDSIWIGKMNMPEKRIKAKMTPNILSYIENLNDDNIKIIYNFFKENPKIKWKESIKRVVGIEIPTEPGKDM
jgi:DNA repair photolyase